MTCPACTQAASRPHSGAYHFGCLHCCARLVASARPCRALQEAMLAAIARFPAAPSKAEIVECLKNAPEKPLRGFSGSTYTEVATQLKNRL